jgi:hypothetical protein
MYSANVSKSGHISLAVKRRERLAGIKSEMMAPPHIVLLSNQLLLLSNQLVLLPQDSKPPLFWKISTENHYSK